MTCPKCDREMCIVTLFETTIGEVCACGYRTFEFDDDNTQDIEPVPGPAIDLSTWQD